MRGTQIIGNGGNVVGSGVANVSFVDVGCTPVLYKGKAWALQCEGCTTRNVSCIGPEGRPTVSVAPVLGAAAADDMVLKLPARAEARVQTTPVATGATTFGTPPCVVQPGEDIQAAIDAAHRGGGRHCLLAQGVHYVRHPVVVPSNMVVAGLGPARTAVRSLMLNASVMRPLCAWERGNCAVFTVNNISRENISIQSMEIDGGLSREYVYHPTAPSEHYAAHLCCRAGTGACCTCVVGHPAPATRPTCMDRYAAAASSRCGLGDGVVSEPCPPCTPTDATETFTRCGWNNFGILIWDYVRDAMSCSVFVAQGGQ